jgi:hypothetical protein
MSRGRTRFRATNLRHQKHEQTTIFHLCGAAGGRVYAAARGGKHGRQNIPTPIDGAVFPGDTKRAWRGVSRPDDRDTRGDARREKTAADGGEAIEAGRCSVNIPAQLVDTTTGAERIAAERQRQIEQEGFSLAHDLAHPASQLVEAAQCYADVALLQLGGQQITGTMIPEAWPWGDEWWKPSMEPARNLEKAGALMAAAIDRKSNLSGRLLLAGGKASDVERAFEERTTPAAVEIKDVGAEAPRADGHDLAIVATAQDSGTFVDHARTFHYCVGSQRLTVRVWQESAAGFDAPVQRLDLACTLRAILAGNAHEDMTEAVRTTISQEHLARIEAELGNIERKHECKGGAHGGADQCEVCAALLRIPQLRRGDGTAAGAANVAGRTV